MSYIILEYLHNCKLILTYSSYFNIVCDVSSDHKFKALEVKVISSNIKCWF